MPPKKQPLRQPARRSGRHTISNDDSPSGAQGEINVTNTGTPDRDLNVSILTTTTIATDIYDDDGDTAMQDPPDTAEQLDDPRPARARSPQNNTTTAASLLPTLTATPVHRLASVLPSSTSRAQTYSQPPVPASSLTEHRPSTLKFKPKSIIRRSKEEREAVAKAESERVATRYAAEAQLVRGGRGRGGRGGRGDAFFGARGRGQYRGDTSFSRREEMGPRIASGPLGGAAVVEKTKKRGTGVEVLEDDGEDEDLVEIGTTGKESVKGKGEDKVKNETGVKPEGGVVKDGDEVLKTSGKGKKGEMRRRDTAAVAGGKGKGRAKVKKEDEHATYISSEGEFDSDTAKKINIEAINLVSSDEDGEEDVDTAMPDISDVAKGKQKEVLKVAEGKKVKNWMSRPVHVERQEHVERAVGINTEASSLTSADLRRKANERKEHEGALFLDDADLESASGARKGRRKQKDVEFVRDERKWKGVYTDDDDAVQGAGGIKVKVEPGEDATTTDAPLVLEKDDEVPGAEAMEIEDVDVNAVIWETTAPSGHRNDPEIAEDLDKEIFTDDEGSVDEEDITSEGSAWVAQDDYDDLNVYDHDQGDDEDHDSIVKIMDDEEEESKMFLKHQPEWDALLAQYTKSKSDDLAAAIEPKVLSQPTYMPNSEETKAARHHKTYLVQLPPLIPSLRDVLVKPTAIKKEKKPSRPEAIPIPHGPFAATHQKDAIKEESSQPPPTLTDQQNIPNAIHQPAPPSTFTAGTTGALTFHSSGKIVASWGDLRFEVSNEREVVGLAQETMMMEYEKVVTRVEDEGRWEDVITVGGRKEGEEGKVAYSGGKVGGGFCMLAA